MLHACVQKFDATGNLENFWELNRALVRFHRKIFLRSNSTRPGFILGAPNSLCGACCGLRLHDSILEHVTHTADVLQVLVTVL